MDLESDDSSSTGLPDCTGPSDSQLHLNALESPEIVFFGNVDGS